MANSIALATEYTDILDAKYKKSSLTANLDVRDEFLGGFTKAGTIEILSVATDGLGDYDRAGGYPSGSTTATWESHTIDNDRAQKFQVDVMDNAEAGGKIFIETARQFMMQEVIPEVDAIRFAKMASAGTTPVEAALADGDAWLAAIDAAVLVMDDAEVPEENRTLYISNTGFSLLKTAGSITRQFETSNAGGKVIERRFWEFDGMRVVKVPKGRFYTSITLDDGTGGGGYTKTAVTGRDINFQIVHGEAVKAITRHAKVRVISSDVNQDADADRYDYRLYHDLLVPANKTAGVYTHNFTS
jgi:hypothetical protein